MRKKTRDYPLYFNLAVLALLAAAIYGWVCNIIAIVNADSVMSGMTIARIVGAFIAPVGAVLGYF